MSPDTAPPLRRPRRRVAKGPPRPRYMALEEIDRLTMVVTALAAEVSALRDRLDTHEALAEAGQAPTAAAIEALRLTPERAAAREAERLAFLRRVFRVLTEELDRTREQGPQAAREWSMPEGWDKT